MLVIVAATSEELQETLRRFPAGRRGHAAGVRLFYSRVHGHEVMFALTGVGSKKAGAAAHSIVKEHSPTAVLSIGAAGALDPRLHIGDIVIADTVLHQDGSRFATDAVWSQKICGHLRDAGMAVSTGSCLTVGEFIHAAEQKLLLFERTAARIVDMESAALAKRLCAAGVPFADIRIVSDTAREDTFNIEAYYAAKKSAGRIGACSYLMHSPGEILQAFKLKRQVRMVSRRIAESIETVLL